MTSSFKRPQHACLPLILDSLSSHLSLLTRLCTRLVTSNISATAIFYTPICNSCLPVCPRKAPLALDFIRQPFPGWSGELGPKLRTHSHVLSFPPSILNCVLLHYWSLVQLSDANSRWWLLPFGFVVAWLCQSQRLTSEEHEMLTAHCESKLLFAYLFSFYHKLAEYVLTQWKTFCELNNLLNHRLQDDSVSVKMQCSKRLLYFSLTKPSVFPLKMPLKSSTPQTCVRPSLQTLPPAQLNSEHCCEKNYFWLSCWMNTAGRCMSSRLYINW